MSNNGKQVCVESEDSDIESMGGGGNSLKCCCGFMIHVLFYYEKEKF